MRILNVSSLYPPHVVGGAEQGLKTLSDAMSAAGHDMHVVTLHPPGSTGKEVAHDDGDITVHRVPLANVYWPFRKQAAPASTFRKMAWHGIDTSNAIMASRVKAIVAGVKPDVVLTRNLQGFSTAVIPTVAGLGVPVVHVLHDYSLLCPQTALWRNGQGCRKRCGDCRLLTAPRHRHLHALSGVIGVSESILEFHRQHGLFEGLPARAIHNALKPSLPIPDALPARPARPFTFGFLGRVEQSKGIETLLAAASRLSERRVPVRVIVAGRGSDRYLRSLQQRYPKANATFVGFVNAVEFFRDIDALVFPSEWMEALGNGVFEAFSQGVPVIGASTGGIPEMIDEDVTGYVFKPGSAIALASAMSRLVRDPGLHETMARAALSRAQDFSPASRVQAYDSFLDQIVDHAKGGLAA